MRYRSIISVLVLLGILISLFSGCYASVEDPSPDPGTETSFPAATQSTQPPATQPPETQPPVTQAPETQPPVTQPPETQPPATQPPVTQPAETKPPVTNPPATDTSDSEPPVIITEKIDVSQGKTVRYKAFVQVKDNLDPNPTIQVDNSKVNLDVPGQYQVTYTAIDRSGNIATATTTLTVWAAKPDANEETVRKMVQDVLDQIIRDDMSNLRKSYEIYHWIKSNIAYTNASDKTDWVVGAYDALKYRQGDCFNFYAVGKALLEGAGIETHSLTKIRTQSKNSRHYWLLVKTDFGWYHFDTCPSIYDEAYFFMKTDEEIWAWDNKYYAGEHSYDPTGAPKVEKDSLVGEVSKMLKEREKEQN